MTFKEWLGADGIDFVTNLYENHGKLSVVLCQTLTDGQIIPHVVHWREGMQVRNWMRANTDVAEADLDDVWETFVITQLGLEVEAC